MIRAFLTQNKFDIVTPVKFGEEAEVPLSWAMTESNFLSQFKLEFNIFLP